MIYTDKHTHWDRAVKDVEMYLNCAYNKTTERTPYELLHGYTPKLTNCVVQSLGLNSTACQDTKMVQQEARDRIKEKQKVMAEYYNRKRVNNVVFDTGEVVAMSAPPIAGEVSKLQGSFTST